MRDVLLQDACVRRDVRRVGSLVYRHIVGLPSDEGDAVLRYLFEHIENPLFQCRFRWQPHSVAFWDNRCVQHRALWDYWPQTRSGFRVTVSGDRPIEYFQ